MGKYNIPQGYSFVQTFLNTFRLVERPIDVLTEATQKFGNTFSFSVLRGKDIVITQDPHFIEHVLKKNHRNYFKSKIISEKLGRFLGNGLLSSNGEYWLRQRRHIQPGFHKEKVKALYSIVQQVIDEFLATFPAGNNVNVYPLMNTLAFRIAIHTLFNVSLPAGVMEELSRFTSEVQAFVVKDIRQPYKSWWHILSGQVRQSLEKSEKARVLIRQIIRERKESGKKYSDLLDMLLEARYEDTGQPMDEEQMVDEIMILVVAGHETTANALAWTLYLLAQHPGELNNLKEITEGYDTEACVQSIPLAAVLKESMRLYPPAWIIDRVALQDDTFDTFKFPKDTIVTLFLYGLHRNGAYWDDPNQFKPARFIDEKADKMISEVYFPFGAGPRICIGGAFAMAEMVLFLQTFIHRFTIRPTGHVPRLLPLVTLRPDKILLNVEKIS